MPLADDLIVGVSPGISRIRELITKIADTNVTVLLTGENGTGKTLAARAIHQASPRGNESFLQFDCAATSEKFLEIELFGVEKSDEMGQAKRGLLDSAHRRTVLFEDIDCLPFELQKRLVRVFQERAFVRCGGKRNHPTDARFMATSRGDLADKVKANLFREDFYYRLNVIPIQLPPLRERPEDIDPLLREFAGRMGQSAALFLDSICDHGLLPYLQQYSWPGNVKELRQVAEMIVLTGDWESVKLLLLGRNAAFNNLAIERCIEFPEEYHQAGVSILSFFGEVLRRQYPEHKAAVRIEQEGLKVRMIVEPLTGDPKVFERALDEYGLVIAGKVTLEDFTDDPFLLLSLRHELRLAHARIESQKDILRYQEQHIGNLERRCDTLMLQIGQALQAPPPHNLSITVSPTISPSFYVNTGIDSAFEGIVKDLGKLATALKANNEEHAVVNELLQEAQNSQALKPEDLAGSSTLRKLRRFIERLSEADDKVGKTISGLKRGVELAQSLARYYNQLAQWFGLPQVPRPFLGDRE